MAPCQDCHVTWQQGLGCNEDFLVFSILGCWRKQANKHRWGQHQQAAMVPSYFPSWSDGTPSKLFSSPTVNHLKTSSPSDVQAIDMSLMGLRHMEISLYRWKNWEGWPLMDYYIKNVFNFYGLVLQTNRGKVVLLPEHRHRSWEAVH